MGRPGAKRGAGSGSRGRWRPEIVRKPPRPGRTSASSVEPVDNADRLPVRASRTQTGATRRASRAALEERIGRIRRALYDLYGDLEYFKSSPLEHRERLRRALSWPDVGHITSLVRALAEEDRFAEWLRFNRCLNGGALAEAFGRDLLSAPPGKVQAGLSAPPGKVQAGKSA